MQTKVAFTPTPEQEAAQVAFRNGKTIAIEALAGSGKTSTLKLLAGHIPRSERALYTAFNRSVILDAKAAFPSNVNVRSNHSLAWGVGRKYQEADRLDPRHRLTPRVLAQHAGWTDRSFAGMAVDAGAHLALEAVTRFQSSADPELTSHHVRVPRFDDGGEIEAAVLHAARKTWDMILNKQSTLPITHDSYLKVWALSEPRIDADVILLDEAQDANPLIVEVLSRQKAQIVIVGDRYQQIYSWRGATNAMQTFPVEQRCWLTQSFRFGDAIAAAANAVLEGHLNTDTRVRGNPGCTSALAPGDGSVVLARTNAALIGEVVAAQAAGVTNVAIVGGVSDLLRLVEGAEHLMSGRRAVKCGDLMDFADWGEVKEYAKTPAGRDLTLLVRLVDDYGPEQLTAVLKSVDGNEQREAIAGRILSTAHKSKGREWDNVTLLGDFRVPNDADLGLPSNEKKTDWSAEDANLLYVAATRAKHVLDTEACLALHDAEERQAAIHAKHARTKVRNEASPLQTTLQAQPEAPARNGDGETPDITTAIAALVEHMATHATATDNNNITLGPGADLNAPELLHFARSLHAAIQLADTATSHGQQYPGAARS